MAVKSSQIKATNSITLIGFTRPVRDFRQSQTTSSFPAAIPRMSHHLPCAWSGEYPWLWRVASAVPLCCYGLRHRKRYPRMEYFNGQLNAKRSGNNSTTKLQTYRAHFSCIAYIRRIVFLWSIQTTRVSTQRPSSSSSRNDCKKFTTPTY